MHGSPEARTCWTMVRAAGLGDRDARARFAAEYQVPIRAYLTARWRGASLRDNLDDAVQEVFVECFKQGGVLEHADAGRGSFRAFLYGVARNVARRFERQAAGRLQTSRADTIWLAALPSREPELSQVFERALARSLLRKAVLRLASMARRGDESARRRYRVLRLRLHDGLPTPAIAAQLGVDADTLHGDFRRARADFRTCLREIVRAHTGAEGEALDAECRSLIDASARAEE